MQSSILPNTDFDQIYQKFANSSIKFPYFWPDNFSLFEILFYWILYYIFFKIENFHTFHHHCIYAVNFPKTIYCFSNSKICKKSCTWSYNIPRTPRTVSPWLDLNRPNRYRYFCFNSLFRSNIRSLFYNLNNEINRIFIKGM